MRRVFTARSIIAMVAVVVATGAAPAVAPAYASGGITGFALFGENQTRAWTPADIRFGAPQNDTMTEPIRVVALSFPIPYPRWDRIIIGAPIGEPLTVGTYAGATATGGSDPQFYLYGDCYQSTGSFEILEIVTDGLEIISLAVDFSVTCVDDPSPTVGSYRYDSTVGFQGLDVSPKDPHRFDPVLGGTTSAPTTVTWTNKGTLPVTPSVVELRGRDHEAFDIEDETCAETRLEPGDTCTVAVSFSPPLLGLDALAQLTLAADVARPTFGYTFTGRGQTAVELEILTPDRTPAFESQPIRVQVSPNQANTRTGSVTIELNGTWLGAGVPSLDGIATELGHLRMGPNEVRAIYNPHPEGSPPTPRVEITRTITGVWPVSVTLTSAWPTTITQGTMMDLEARFSAPAIPAHGVFRIRNAATGAIIASKPANDYQLEIRTRLLSFPVGDTPIVAEFVGDEVFEQATVTRTQTVTPDTLVETDDVYVSPAAFYPYADGYRDRLVMKGSTLESASVSVRIYDSRDRLVRTLSLGSKNGPYTASWNGRRADGSAVPSGRYLVRQRFVDTRGNVLNKDTMITLSWRRVRWVVASITRNGEAYSSYARGGSGSISKSASSYSSGVRLTGGRKEGYAVVRWRFALRSGLAYRGLSVSVLGKGTSSSSRAILAFGQDAYGAVIGPQYRWWRTTGSVSGHVNDRIVLLDVETDGPMSGAFDVAKARVMYSYAVWQ
jgi:hypothetical protein